MPKKKYLQRIGNRPYFYTVDVGLRTNGGTAIAMFGNAKTLPVEYKFIQAQFGAWETRADAICYIAKKYFETVLQGPVFLERPKFFDSHLGLTAARSDSLEKLMVLYGRLYQVVHDVGFSPVPLEIIDWKGGIPKKIMKARIERLTGEKYNSDVADAVGMGLYLKGLL